MHSFRHNRIIVIVAWSIWLLVTICVAWKHFQQPDFQGGLWAIPAIGFLLCMGVVVWALLEADKDLAWKDNPPVKDEEIEVAKREIAATTHDFVLAKEATIEITEGKRIPGWNGWRQTVEGFASTLAMVAAFQLLLVPIKLLFESSSEQLWGSIVIHAPAMFLGVIFWWFRIRTKTIFDIPLRHLGLIATEFRECYFYQYQHATAKRLGFVEIGDFKQRGFVRTVFANRDKSVLVEVGLHGGSPCYRITSATPEGLVLQTSTNGVAIETEKAVHRILAPTFGASGQVRWKSIPEAIKRHVKWVAEYVAENDVQLLVLNEANLAKVMQEAESKVAQFGVLLA